jgi:hypothetical protein
MSTFDFARRITLQAQFIRDGRHILPQPGHCLTEALTLIIFAIEAQAYNWGNGFLHNHA